MIIGIIFLILAQLFGLAAVIMVSYCSNTVHKDNHCSHEEHTETASQPGERK